MDNAMAGARTLRWVLGLSFIAMALWMLVPDKLDDAGIKEHPLGRADRPR